MLEVEGLTARAGGFTLADVGFAVGAGECHAVLGPSGSGKSTLLNSVLGILPLRSGRIRLAGEDITHLPVERRRLGYVPQQLGLFPHLSVADNLAYSARARRIPDAEFRPLLERLIAVTGIGHLLDRRPATLSGGERQRVALVRALAANPRLVLLDEPFTALNESLRRDLWWLLKELQAERGLTTLLVTHDLAEAHFLADRVTVLIAGRQEQSAAKDVVYRRPASVAVARFLGLKNLFEARLLAPNRVECAAVGGVVAADTQGMPDRGPVWLAIRAEHVALRHPDDAPRPDEARLAGRFEAVLDLGEAAVLRFRATTGAQFEIRCGSRTLRRYELRRGFPGLVGLPARDLFTLPRREGDPTDELVGRTARLSVEAGA